MKTRVLIIGGGFAGMEMAKGLDKELFEITLIDKSNHHQFQPLFYQVAASQIEPASISFPFRYVFKGNRNIRIRMAEVTEIHPERNTVSTSAGEFEFDYLIIATGCKTNFFGRSSIEKNSLTLKTTHDAIAIRNHVISVFEKIMSARKSERKPLCNLVIAGAGPTGVELAGAFAEMKRFALPEDYPGTDFSRFGIYLIEGGKRILNTMSEESGRTSLGYLRKMGVKVITETFVTDYDGRSVALSDGTTIPAETLIWTAGVKGHKIRGLPQECWMAHDRLMVDRFSKVEGFDRIYAVGDIAFMTTPLYPSGHPQVANVAINQARLLCRNLKNIILRKNCHEYEYSDMGTMATIGRNKAVVDLPFMRLSGYLAWLIWMYLHLMLILTVRNKMMIFIDWAWSYISGNSSLRLIIRSDKSKFAGN